MSEGAVVVVGGTRAIGFELVKHYLEAGREVVLTGRDPASVEAAVSATGGRARGIAFDLADPPSVAPALAEVGPVARLALVAIDRDHNALKDYSIERAVRLVTMKLVGFTAVVSALLERFDASTSIVLFGGMAKERPYPGSTTITTVNGGIVGLTRTLVEELKPVRVNSIHPGVVGDSPYWADKEAARTNYASQTPIARLVTMEEIVDATVFLLENTGVNGVDLIVDGGWHTR